MYATAGQVYLLLCPLEWVVAARKRGVFSQGQRVYCVCLEEIAYSSPVRFITNVVACSAAYFEWLQVT